MIRVFPVDKGNVALHWPHIEAWVDTARGADKTFAVEDIRRECETGEYQLWLAVDDEEYLGFFIAVSIPAPRGKIYHLPWLGGKNLASWVDHISEVEEWARASGHIAFCFIGRKAWKRLIGYDYEGVYYYKNL